LSWTHGGRCQLAGLENYQSGNPPRRDIPTAVEQLNGRAEALYICVDPLVNATGCGSMGWRWPRGCDHAQFRDNLEGGLRFLWTRHLRLFRRAAEYVDKILHGAKPGDLPVEQPIKIELVIKSQDGQGARPRHSASILARADE